MGSGTDKMPKETRKCEVCWEEKPYTRIICGTRICERCTESMFNWVIKQYKGRSSE